MSEKVICPECVVVCEAIGPGDYTSPKGPGHYERKTNYQCPKCKKLIQK